MNDDMKTRLVPRPDNAGGNTIRIDTQNIPIQRGQGGTVIIDRMQSPSPQAEHTRLVRISSASASAPAGEGPAANSSEIGWVVGWLAAISGPMKGQSFNLGVGQNSIGRDNTNRVCLKDDPGISRKGHLVITYDPRRNRFSARPGTEGSGITDLNDELLEMPTTLKRGDTFRLSDDTQMRFIPLCDEEFTWS